MDIPVTQLPPGDPRLVEAIVGQLKSKGIFDQFRKECLADVDTKPAFQNLRQRVEGHVNKFLEKNTWKNDLNKNQLRDGVRKHVQSLGILDSGIDAIITQVLNPKIKPLILPYVEDTVYTFLQIDKPKRERQADTQDQDITQLQHGLNIMDAKPGLLPMETDVISSEEDDILARESPDSINKSPPTPEDAIMKSVDEDAQDGFGSFGQKTIDQSDIVAQHVEKLNLEDEQDSKPLPAAKPPPLPLFDDQSLDSISSNSSGLTFSPLSGKGSPSSRKSQENLSKTEESPKAVQDVRSTTSTPLVDEMPPVEDEEISKSSLESEPTKDLGSPEPKQLESSNPLASLSSTTPSETPMQTPSHSSIGAGKEEDTILSGTSLVSLDEDSQESKASLSKTSVTSEKSEAEEKAKSEKSEGEITSSGSELSDSDNKVRPGEKPHFQEKHRSDYDSSHKSRKEKSEYKSKHDSHSRDRDRGDRDKDKDKDKDKDRDRDSRHSKEKERKHSKSRDDHHSHRDRDKKHHRRDKDHDGDRDRPRGHHHESSTSSSHKEGSSSGSGSGKGSGEKEKERSSHQSSDKSSESKRREKSETKSGEKQENKANEKSENKPSEKPSNKSGEKNESKSKDKFDKKSSKSESKSGSKSDSKDTSKKEENGDKTSSKHKRDNKRDDDKLKSESKDEKKKKDEKESRHDKEERDSKKESRDKREKEGKDAKRKDDKDTKKDRDHKDSKSDKEEKEIRREKERKSMKENKINVKEEEKSCTSEKRKLKKTEDDKIEKKKKITENLKEKSQKNKTTKTKSPIEEGLVLVSDSGNIMVCYTKEGEDTPDGTPVVTPKALFESDEDSQPESFEGFGNNNNNRKGEVNDFQGFESCESDCRLANYLRHVIRIPDEMDMECHEWFDDEDLQLSVDAEDLGGKISLDEFFRCMQMLGAIVRDSNGVIQEYTKNSDCNSLNNKETPSNPELKRGKRRRMSTCSSASSSNSSSGSPKHKRSRTDSNTVKGETTQLVEQGSVIVSGYALLTPEDDGNRTSSREYDKHINLPEVDYSQRINTYSPLSPASDSSADDSKVKQMEVTLESNSDVKSIGSVAEQKSTSPAKMYKNDSSWPSEDANLSV